MSIDRSNVRSDTHHEPRMRPTRRDFLGQVIAAGVAGIGLSGLVAACGDGSDQANQNNAAADCDDTTGLSEAELQKREALDYVAVSPNPDEVCDNCRFYTLPEEGEVCGGCQLFAGPVTAGGYCVSWAAQPS